MTSQIDKILTIKVGAALLLFVALLLAPLPDGLSEQGRQALAVMALAVVLWATAKAIEVAAGIAKNRSQGLANIKQMLFEHTGKPTEEQFWNEVNARQDRFRGLAVEDGFKDFLDRKGRKPRVS